MIRWTMSLMAASLMLVWATNAAAVECTDDSDCAAGEFCAKVPCVAPCDTDDPDCEPIPCPDIGECMEGGDPGWESECETDADCADGLVCDEVGGMACACMEGGDCPECAEPTIIYGCVPAPCESDADCGDGMACITIEIPCAGTSVSCPPGEECPEPDPVPCEGETESFCAPEWAGECEADADCGEHFTCVANEICECSGGGAVPTEPAEPDSGGGGSGAPMPMPPEDGSEDPPECSCYEGDHKYCQPNEIECVEDADCPTDWTCMDAPNTTVPCAVDPESGEVDCPEPEPTLDFCAPPGFEEWAGAMDAKAGAEEYANQTGGASDTPEDPTNPPADGNATPGTSDNSGGTTCQSGGAPLDFALIALLALIAIALRRRA